MEITASIVKETGGSFNLKKLSLDEPGPNEVLVKVVAVGTCHTDIVARDNFLGTPNFPVVLGHEAAGIVEKTGGFVTGLQPGDHVVMTFGYCGQCTNCKTRNPHIVQGFCRSILVDTD